MVATKKHLTLCPLSVSIPMRGRVLQGKPRIKTWSWMKSYIDVRFYQALLLDEEVKKERPLSLRKGSGSKKEKSSDYKKR